MQNFFKREKRAKTSTIVRRMLFVFVGLVLGLNVYHWNAYKLVGNAMPTPFGYGAAVVLSGSMEPTLSVNDLVIIKEADVYAEGDIVVYQTGKDLIIHRIIGIEDGMVYTQGDANNAQDTPTDVSQIKGKLLLHIPIVGALVRFLKTVPGTVIVLAIAIVLMELSWKKEKAKDIEDIEAIKREIRKLREEQEK